MTRKGADTATLVPYLPRLAIEWAGSDPSTTFRVVDGSLVFADVSGFTALSERLARNGRHGAEELTETVGRCFGDLLRVAYDAGGSLIKFGGDALLLLFDGEDHAARACVSALGMRATMAEVGRVTTTVGNVRLRMSVGVHSGALDLFRVGRSHRELIVTGPASTAIVDMEAAASANEIVLSPGTAALVDTAVIGAARGPGFLLRDRPPEATTRDVHGHITDDGAGVAESIPIALREQLLEGQVESEHRQVSVAFIHFDGVDGMLASSGAAAVAAALDQLVADVQEAADTHGVTFLATDVDRDGGKIILVAGAPRALGDDEDRMLRCVRSIADGRRMLPVRIGVNRGPVFVGEVGPSFRRTYTVMGDAVNLAARLMATATPGQVLATATVLDQASTDFQASALPPFMVKGKAHPVHAYAVGARGERRAERPAGQLPLEGRHAELVALTSVLEGARAGRGRFVEITGDAGIGKSRLVQELLDRADGVTITRSYCEPFEASTPYYAIRFLLRAVAGIRSGGTEGGGQLRLTVERSMPSLLPWLPLLATVADVDVAETAEAADLEPRFRRKRICTVVTELLRSLVATPLLSVVEDGQWMDALSAEVLTELARGVSDRPWVICLVRRDTNDADSGGPAAVWLPLNPLDDAAAHSLVSAAMSADLLPHQRDALVARAGGNPLFLEELLRAHDTRDRDAPLPESLEAVVTAQIDGLAPADRRLLRAASVLGTIFDAELVAAVTDGAVRSAAAVTRHLAAFIEVAGPGLLRFRNECSRQVAYSALPFSRRRQLHADAGDALERAAAGRALERAGTLSFHYLHAQRYEQCWRYARAAAEQARDSYANVEAAELYERALSVRSHVQVGDTEVAETWEALGDVAVLAGDFDRARTAYRSARSLRGGDTPTLANLCAKEYTVAMHQGKSVNALRWIRRGLRLLDGHEGTDEVARRAELRYFYAHARQQGGRPRDALRWSELAAEDALRSGNRAALASSYLLQDWALLALGRAEEATHAGLALRICDEELASPTRTAETLLYLGNFAYMRGQWDEALQLWARARDAYLRAGNTVHAAFGACNSAEVLVHQGRYDEAEPRLREALETWKAMGYAGGVGDVLGNLGRLALNRGDLDEATRLFDEVRSTFQAAGDGREIGATGALAECLLRRGSVTEALELLEGAIGREQMAGDRVFSAMLHRLRGYAWAGLGRIADAWADFDESLAVGRASGAAYEIALTLEAISVVAELGGLAQDRSADEERAALLSQLGVEVTPPPPLAIAA